MAGDWLKMRTDLQTHPKVVRILSAMRRHDVGTVTDKFRVIGGLHAVWSVFDTHSTDGKLNGYTPELLDHIIGWDGFSQAMIEVEWLFVDGAQTLVLPEFSEHNGQSAKRRAEDQKRKRNTRKTDAECPHDDMQDCGQIADKLRTRDRDREREDISSNSDELLVIGGSDDGELVGEHTPECPCPHKEIIAIYHELLPANPRIRDWGPSRAKHLRARWGEQKDRQDLDFWRRFFGYVAKSDFLTGKTPKPFTPNLEWLVTYRNFVRIIEGNYENK
jgi:hypothetical protein